MSNPLLDAAGLSPNTPRSTTPPTQTGTLIGVQLTPIASAPVTLQARITELEAQLRQAQDEITGNRTLMNDAETVRTERTLLAAVCVVLAIGWWRS